jgi:hypothetical protein
MTIYAANVSRTPMPSFSCSGRLRNLNYKVKSRAAPEGIALPTIKLISISIFVLHPACNVVVGSGTDASAEVTALRLKLPIQDGYFFKRITDP